MVANAVPELRDRAWALADEHELRLLLRPERQGPDAPGLIRGGFWLDGDGAARHRTACRGDYCGMGERRRVHRPPLRRLQHRAAHRVLHRHRARPDPGRALLRPLAHVPRHVRLVLAGDRGRSASGANYLGVDVFEGAYRYDDQLVVPTWGGSMFEALMVPLVVPEEEWGPSSWAVTHPLYVESQIEFGLDEAGYGYWGFSPASNPAGGYREYGVDAIGMEPNGYAADVERLTLVDPGWDDPACLRGRPTPIRRLRRGRRHAARRLPGARLRTATRRWTTSPTWRATSRASTAAAASRTRSTWRPARSPTATSSLDQGMVIAAIANELLERPAAGLPGGDAAAVASAAHGDRGVRRGSNGAVSSAHGRGRRSAIGG